MKTSSFCALLSQPGLKVRMFFSKARPRRGVEPEEGARRGERLYNASDSLLMTEPVKRGNSIMAMLKKKAAIQKSLAARADARCRSR